MKARPILFSGPMVQALLDGRKSQTRRVVKGEALDWLEGAGFSPSFVANPENEVCPYGQPSDLLWVRETWQDYCPLWHGAWCGHGTREGKVQDHQPVYKADDEITWLRGPEDKQGKPLRWKPSIHMPRWVSRLTLEVTGVRVERLREISEADASAEGLKAMTKDGKLVKYGLPDRDGSPGTDDHGWPWADWHIAPIAAYRRIWESINGPGSWEANPWVWVLEFKVHRCNVDELMKARGA